MMSFAARSITALLAAASLVTVEGNAFLRAQPHAEQHVAADAVKELLLSELSLVKKDGSFAVLREELRVMYAALPKNRYGRLDSSVVRYALHRYFVQTRGWFVEGLQPNNGKFNSSSPVEIMKDRVPAFLQSIFEERVHGRGLDLEDLAAFAATIQELVHKESTDLLMEAYTLLDLPMDTPLDEKNTALAVETYLLSVILGTKVSTLKRWQVETVLKNAHRAYPAWPDVTLWAHDLRRAENHLHKPTNPFSGSKQVGTPFPEAATFIEKVGHKFGSFQDHECREMKDMLMEKEHQGSGRVRLSEFYQGSLDGNWQFSESVEYLRSIGALDETDPKMPAVVIPNYVTSHSNCLASSSFYSVCCLNECEVLMTQLERAVALPMAASSLLANLVANMSSSTVDAPRTLPSSLLDRLEDISVHHGGDIPLHGRLFAQWMHHAFPRECPYPHTAGTTNPMTPDEWMAASGDNAIANVEDMSRYISAGSNNTAGPLDIEEPLALPWSMSEELIDYRPYEKSSQEASEGIFRTFLDTFRPVAQLAVVVASGYAIFSTVRPALRGEEDLKLPR
eukprot:CAMPEP_0206449206 /NCGR_PEP_ID=MMETSP0324_2-20121206/17950_1 /ASSEMBLY_ACC=CAM_ASM_000836 /TAXON_ID=2866 /ORGANISM="Crypthecodinium cohnii, Strain Seligo" /LENGTH=564 /DNA_ID=CAMNT_0053918537 /DNA_START=81 /DNA_END=1771 /DNA_ORIENTATION=+